MFRAMAMKELREVAGIGLSASAAQAYLAVAAVHPDMFPFICRYGAGLPFVDDDFIAWFICICVVTAVALGARQTLGESIHGTYPLLFHRPATRRWLIGVKLLVGMAVYLTCGVISILGYGLWAATPGTHSSPFEWWMTLPAWTLWLGMTILYLGAFLCGIRPGRWLGTRLWPLAAAGLATFVAVWCFWEYQNVLLWGLILVIDAWLIGAILFVGRTRDYS
jgi:hypothetical protein